MSNGLESNLLEFQRIASDLANIEEDLSDEDFSDLLLHNLLESYHEVKMGFKYERDRISLEKMVSHFENMRVGIENERSTSLWQW